jgi:DNA-binding GntR family transcriptional regulator
LEPAALELAIHLDHGGLTSALDAVCSGMASACERGDMAICLQRDTEFHAQLFEFCGNDYLRNAYGLIAHKLAAIRTQMATRSDDRADCFAGHGKLLTAIQARKLQRAKALLREHLHEAHTFYRTNLDRIVAEAPRHYGHLPGLVLEHDAHRQPAPTSR